MLRLTIKNLAANKIRLALTGFAVVLAVSFIVSSFVLTDGLRSSFGDLSEEITGSIDYEIRPTEGFGQPDELPESAIAAVAAVDGVGSALPNIEAQNVLRPINAEGESITTNGPPQLAYPWTDDAGISAVAIVEGVAPTGSGQFTMDVDAAANHGFEPGQTYDMITPSGAQSMTLTGLTRFGEDNTTLGATLMHFELDTLQDLLGRDGVDAVDVILESGADRGAVAAALEGVVPGTVVISQADLLADQRAEFDSGINVLNTVLLAFGAVSVLVSIFLIYNTFSIVLSQRTREMALLRTVGASPAQLNRSVLTESFIIGTVASVVGIGAGIGVAYGLRGAFDLLGISLPDSPLVVSARTVAVALAVGIIVTMVSSVFPARKASRVPPIAALRDGVSAGSVGGRTRTVIGAILLGIGLVAGGYGLFQASSIGAVATLIGVGAFGVILGVTVLSPLVAVPVTKLLGWPGTRAAGISGRLARDNAGRNPQRTSTTAAALMIGLAVVSMTLVVGESVKAQFRSTLESSVKADYLVTEEGGYGLTPELIDRIDELDVSETVTYFNYGEAMIDDEIRAVMATDLATNQQLFDLGLQDGVAYDQSVEHPLLVANEEAEAKGIAVGDSIAMLFESGDEIDFTVIGIHTDDLVAEDPYVLDTSTWQVVDPGDQLGWIAFSVVDGVTAEAVQAAMAPIVADVPQAEVDTFGGYVDNIEGQIDNALAAVNVLLVLAVIIALIGIANTLALSVYERTRELGLLRAVGMTRRQLRRMIRLEAALVALFGAALGAGVGVLFGWAAVEALPAGVTETLSVPTVRIAILMAVAGLAGLVAAWLPARRAGKLDVLEAIAS